jgi:hypothetical protein
MPVQVAESSGVTSMTPWKQEALPDVEASLARQIGPMARFLLKKVADKAEGLDHLSELLLPHIPVGGRDGSSSDRPSPRSGRSSTPRAPVPAWRAPGHRPAPAARRRPGGAVRSVRRPPPEGFDEAYADATADKLVAIIGPIGRVVVKRAMKQTGDKHAFLQLLAEPHRQSRRTDALPRGRRRQDLTMTGTRQ